LHKKLSTCEPVQPAKTCVTQLTEYGLEWEDVKTLIESIVSYEQIATAIKDPADFFENLLKKAGPVAKQFALAALKPKLTPLILPLKWEDVLPAIELMSSPDRLQKAVTKPDVFLKELLAAVGPAGKKIVLANLRPKLEPLLQTQKPPLTWEVRKTRSWPRSGANGSL
jgi:hypothetical protein